MTVTCEIQCTDERNLPELLVLSEILRGKIAVKFVNGDTLCLNKELYSSSTIAKHILEKAGRNDLLGNAAEILEMENWMRFSQLYLSDKRLLINGLSILDQALAHASYLVGNNLTCADIFIWSKLKVSWDEQDKTDGLTNVKRYFAHLSDHPELSAVASCLEKTKASKRAAKEDSPSDSGVKFEEGGKFVELPGAEMGKVVVRFPPEASGYLHIGHAKAALLNQHYQQSFKGKLILRFDDTNPAKETEEFERVILEDVKMLGITHDHFSRTSDHFDTIILMCERLLVEGKAYVDDTDADTMKAQRERREESACRKNTVKQNMDAWEEMKKGTERGLQRCVRAKIDMQSDNGCLRDPTIYRCKNEPHLTTGTKYRVYPTYDFACPIVDSIEGVTHALRTTEYHDRDVQYYWFVEQLGIRRPIIYDYSRLNLQNTVLSKRKLTWFVQQGLVSGWDDPRFPTVRGILRKGLTIEGLKQFIIAQGSSKSICIMEWDKIWSFNKKVIDPVAPRYTALDRVNVVPVIVSGQSSVEIRDVAAHPKNAEVGMKKVWYGPKIWMEREDADAIANIGVNVTFINWGNLRITGLERGKDGHVTEVKAELNLDDKDFKKTMKVTWLSEADGDGKTVPVVARYFGHIISKPVLSKTDDFKNFINKESKREELLMGDPLLRHLKKGEIIQLQRRGFFIVDKAYEQIRNIMKYIRRLNWDEMENLVAPNQLILDNSHTGLGSPVVLIYIPDGHTKNQVGETQAAASSGGSAKKPQSPKKKGQKSPQRSQKSSATTPGDKSFSILVAIKEQGDKVRNLKTAGASKEEIGKTVEQLLQLKKDYRAESGADWKPDLLEKAQKAKGEAAAPKPADKPTPTSGEDKSFSILVAIKEQGDKVRNLKTAGASKEEIGKAVEQLLQLKKDYRAESGADWKPDLLEKAQKAKGETAAPKPADKPTPTSGEDKAFSILVAIKEQGDKVRNLKTAGASKEEIGKAVEQLLQLKKDYRAESGADWKPDLLEKAQKAKGEAAAPKPADKPAEKKDGQRSQKSSATADGDKAYSILVAIKEIGDKIRNMKAAKASKENIGKEVEQLKKLKAEFRAETGSDWKPDLIDKAQKAKSETTTTTPAAPKVEETPSRELLDQRSMFLLQSIKSQGDTIGALKAAKAEKPDIEKAVRRLQKLKKDFKRHSGMDWKSDLLQIENSSGDPSGAQLKKQTRLGLEAKKESDLPEWYSQVITKSEMIEYYDVSGCYILRPWAYAIWEEIKAFFDCRIKRIGVRNCYFPIFVSQSALEREKTHIADFAPEVAWVTKSGKSELAEPIAVRPTSETVMYPAYAKWVQSHRDLPILLNQWNNVVRWEFKHPQPFLRTREFLWQEGHTAHSTREAACKEVYTILDFYASIYIDLLAIPVVKGRKTEKEKFAGADFTTTVEAYISASGRAIQGATSHHLGQNFSKMFDIQFEDAGEKRYAHQNSWGLTTRTIGVLTMVHGDNKGLILPPRVACIQAVIVPCGITAKTTAEEKATLLAKCEHVRDAMLDADIRVEADLKDHVSPGWKFNHWELKGVPLRIEIGPKDMAKKQVVFIRRDSSSKQSVEEERLIEKCKSVFEEIHEALYTKAKKELEDHLRVCESFDDFCTGLDQKCLLLSPFCGDEDCEDQIKKDSARNAVVEEGAPSMGAKSLCIPFDQPRSITADMKCINPKCSKKPQFFCMFGRSY